MNVQKHLYTATSSHDVAGNAILMAFEFFNKDYHHEIIFY